MPYITDGAVDILRSLDRRMAAVEQHMAALRAGIAFGADVALIGAVYAVAGDRPFKSCELLTMAARPGVPERVLFSMIGGRSPGSVGKQLRAAAGKPCDNGLMLTWEPGSSPNIWRVSPPRIPANC